MDVEPLVDLPVDKKGPRDREYEGNIVSAPKSSVRILFSDSTISQFNVEELPTLVEETEKRPFWIDLASENPQDLHPIFKFMKMPTESIAEYEGVLYREETIKILDGILVVTLQLPSGGLFQFFLQGNTLVTFHSNLFQN
jgi:hypothetical protein